MPIRKIAFGLGFISYLLAVSAQAHWFHHPHPEMWADVPHGAEHKHYDHHQPYHFKDRKAPKPVMVEPGKHVTRYHKDFWRKVKVYKNPQINERALDFCYLKNHFCGRTAANAFCKRNGFQYASKFKIDRHALHTQNLGDYQLNHYKEHAGNGFTYIRCRKHY